MEKIKPFAAFVKANLHDVYTEKYFKLITELKVPLLDLFKHLSREELQALTKQGTDDFLTSLKEGTMLEKSRISLEQWKNDELPGIRKNDVQPSDLVLIYYAQKYSLLSLLPQYTNDVNDAIDITLELMDYYKTVQADAFEVLFEIQDEQKSQIREKEKELLKNLEKLRKAQTIASLGDWEWLINENIVNWSEQMYKIYETKPGKKIDFNKFLKLIHPDDREMLQERIQAALDKKESYEFYHRIVTKTGKIKIIHARGEIETDSKGNAIRLFGTGQDVTQVKSIEQALINKAKDLERSNLELERFAYVASHDLQEPLRKIQAFGERLGQKFEDKLGDEGKDYINRMQNAAERMQTLIDDLLSFSRITTNKDTFADIDLTKIVNDVLNDLEVSIQKKSAKVKVGKLPVIEAIHSQMRQLFQNLISNSLKFSQPGVQPVIEITASRQKKTPFDKNLFGSDKYHRIQVKDNGIGFENQYAERIFVIFQRLHPRTEFEGSGVGLALCKRIVENHHGFIEAQSKPGKGTCFTIYLPLEQHSNNTDVRKFTSQPSVSHSHSRG